MLFLMMVWRSKLATPNSILGWRSMIATTLLSGVSNPFSLRLVRRGFVGMTSSYLIAWNLPTFLSDGRYRGWRESAQEGLHNQQAAILDKIVQNGKRIRLFHWAAIWLTHLLTQR